MRFSRGAFFVGPTQSHRDTETHSCLRTQRRLRLRENIEATEMCTLRELFTAKPSL